MFPAQYIVTDLVPMQSYLGNHVSLIFRPHELRSFLFLIHVKSWCKLAGVATSSLFDLVMLY